MQPIIGITSNYEVGGNTFCLKDFYVHSIFRAGGIPVILPPTLDDSLIEEYFDMCNGFLLSGGGDLDPMYWGALPDSRIGEINPFRDKFEISLAQKAFQLRKPTLGICRGCQVMNVATGGTLLQDIDSTMCHMQNAPRNYPFHDISIESNSKLHKIIKSDTIRVNSFHHQAIEKPGIGVQITALAADKTVEAIEGKRHMFYVGVQWHPECLNDEYSSRLFIALTQKSRHS